MAAISVISDISAVDERLDSSGPRPASVDASLERRMRRDELQASITRLSSALHEAEPRVSLGIPRLDEAIGGGLSRRGVHEWFALGDRVPLRMPPMGVLIHLAWRALALESPSRRRGAVWIGAACRPPAAALLRGLRGVVDGRRPTPDRSLLERSIFVEARTPQERSWAIEQAARCPGVFLVVADAEGFDAGLSRRVQLAAQGGSLVALARPDRERGARSVAMTRWLVVPEAAPMAAGEAHAPHAIIGERPEAHRGPLDWPPSPRWRVVLLRSKQSAQGAGASGTATTLGQ